MMFSGLSITERFTSYSVVVRSLVTFYQLLRVGTSLRVWLCQKSDSSLVLITVMIRFLTE
jgi:hypothetical protein